MKITFIGGGSLRLLPILRGIFQETPEVLRGGEIRLTDLKVERSEAVARMIKACPEYKNVNCKVEVFTDLDKSLEGTDILYLTMAAVREPTETQSLLLAQEYGYMSSDQLSINGAFLSLRLGNFILSLARKLEKLSPKALMLIFSNPVAVYSAMVNNHTRIRALGICGGFNNHRWDLTRMCGGRGFDPQWNVVAAGVNHCSFILRGDYKGEDLYSSLFPRVFNENWQCPDCTIDHAAPDILEFCLKRLYDLYRKYNTLVFSSEGDGMGHVFMDFSRYEQKRLANKIHLPFDPEAKRQEEAQAIEERFASFIKLSKTPKQVDWSNKRDSLTGVHITDITIPILKALAGFDTMRIVASRPNGGAVTGFPDNAALEYTMDLYKDTITPVENQYVPAPFKGLIASLSEFQTLIGDAIALHDPAVFAAALDAYPVHRLEPERKEFFAKMFDIYTDIDPVWKKALEYML